MHGSLRAFDDIKRKSRKADLILCCGDFTIFENDMIKILKKFDSLTKRMVIIPGNHETGKSLSEACKKTKNIHFINNSFYEDESLVVLGSEGDGFAIEDKEFRRTAKKFKNILSKKRNKKHILITHAPPYGTKHDLLIDEHCGNKDIRDFIEDSMPLYAFCGHIHENSYTKDTIGQTKTMNPGPTGRVIRI